MSASRSKRLLVGVLALGVCGGAWAVASHREELRARWLRRRLEHASSEERPLISDALVALGEPGRRQLEAVAFAATAPLTSDVLELRQLAYDTLWKLEGEHPPMRPSFLARCLVDARGLKRDDLTNVLWELDVADPAMRRELVNAAVATVERSDDPDGAEAACHYLRSEQSALAQAALREAMLASPHDGVRWDAALGLEDARDPRNSAVLRRALADPVEDVRLAAARALAEGHHDPAGLEILVAGLRASCEHLKKKIVPAVRALEDKRTILALVRVLEDPEAGDHAHAEARTTLEAFAGQKCEDWRAWLEAHCSELPPQLDPEKLPVQPLVVASEGRK